MGRNPPFSPLMRFEILDRRRQFPRVAGCNQLLAGLPGQVDTFFAFF
jgi:hypothetical protein